MFIIIALVVLAVVYLVYIYNSLVGKKNNTEEAWSDIQVQMKRRYNIIPNLVETVKGYAKHEAGTLEKVVKARNEAMKTTGAPHEQAEAENILQGTLKSLFALSESYPDLKANENFMHLQQELVDAEDKLQAARRFYNTNVKELNTLIEQFPSNLIANNFKFEKKEYFELDAGESDVVSKVPKVEM